MEEFKEYIPIEGEIQLHYLGHSSFVITTDELTILMDPYSPQVGYGELQVEADLVTVSHEHMDHNYVAAAPEARVLRGLTADGMDWEDVSFSTENLTISTLSSYHDEAGGKLRGRNSIFILELEGLRLVHLGDLGHILGEGEVEKLKPVHVLLTPVGGHYTIDAEEARQVVEALSPSIVVPMHYRTDATRNWPITDLAPFLEGEKNVKEKGSGPVVINKEVLPETLETWVLEPADL